MSKPFSIQAPENIAKEYGGDKQRIAQAAQMGVVDPTAAVLAGMFIDRMRNAQRMEGANPPTVAQQVMGGAPPAQPVPPLPAGGLGGTSQAAPPMAPPMPEMGMAEGGIVGLDIPETMFDEASNGGFNDGYAGGGLVAFAGGGGIDPERLRRALRAQESGGDYGVTNAEGSGAMGAYQFMPDTARALAKRLGIPYRPELMAGAKARTKEGIAYQEKLMDAQMEDIMRFSGGDLGKAAAYHFAGPNERGWKGKTRKYQQDIQRRYSGGEEASEPQKGLPERDIRTPEGRLSTFKDQLGVARELYGELPEGGLGELEAFYRQQLDPKEQRARRKEDMWATLAQIGASMASSNSPFFLQAVGEAIGAALPGANASRKERIEAERDAQRGLKEVLGMKRSQQKEVLEFAKDLRAAEMGVEMNEVEMAERRRLQQDEQAWRSSEADKEHTRALEQIRTQGTVANSQFEQMVAARKQQIKDRLAQGLPVTDPSGKVMANASGTLAASEIEVLAQLWAEYDRQRYRPTRQGVVDPMAGALQPQTGGAGTNAYTGFSAQQVE